MSNVDRLADHARDELMQRDLGTVEGAVRMVAFGAAVRVTLVCMADPAALLPRAIAAGQRAGVIVRGDRRTGNLAIEVGPLLPAGPS